MELDLVFGLDDASFPFVGLDRAVSVHVNVLDHVLYRLLMGVDVLDTPTPLLDTPTPVSDTPTPVAETPG